LQAKHQQDMAHWHPISKITQIKRAELDHLDHLKLLLDPALYYLRLPPGLKLQAADKV